MLYRQVNSRAGHYVPDDHPGESARKLPRLAEIDAPELKQAYGRVSRQHLASQVAGRMVTVEWFKRDRYKRIVGKVLLDGHDINITLIEAGLAWHYRKYAYEQSPEDRQRYARVEEQARVLQAGLWQEKHPLPPWEYRKARKSKPAGTTTMNHAGSAHKIRSW